MKIGMMSDSHGSMERTREAAVQLRALGIEYALHAGDVGDPSVLHVLSEALGVQGIPVVVVEGNMDRGVFEVWAMPTGSGVHLASGRCWRGTLCGQRVALLHGDDKRTFDALRRSDACDLLVFGHTHKRLFHVEGNVTLINPGALVRTAEPGAAWYDTKTRTHAFIDV